MSELFGRPEHITDPEVVRWLRSATEYAGRVPVPRTHDARRGYSRTLVHRSDAFEILVLHWEPGAVSAIHDHGGAHCWFAVASGAVGVENYRRFDNGSTDGFARIGAEGRLLLHSGEIDYREDDVHLHRCFAGDEPAVTLHVYAKPIERFFTFDERAQRCAHAVSTYDAVL